MSASARNYGIMRKIRARLGMLLNLLLPHVSRPAMRGFDPFATFDEWSSDADEEAYRTL